MVKVTLWFALCIAAGFFYAHDYNLLGALIGGLAGGLAMLSVESGTKRR